MDKKGPKIRIKDIAEKAGVSTGTVDRVLHKRGEVKEETRNKVMSILDELGYTPNLIARSLASKKTAQISVLFPSPKDNNPYWDQPISGIQKGIEELKDYNTEVKTIQFLATDENSFIAKAKEIIEEKPNGVVFNPVFKQASLNFIQELKEHKIPFILFDINLQTVDSLAYYGQHAKESGRTAASLLYNSLPQNANVLIVNLGNNKFISHHLKTRAAGFKAYFEEFRTQKTVHTHTLAVDLLNQEDIVQKLELAYRKIGQVDGIFAPSSRVFKVAHYLEHYNRTVPLVGYDIIEPNIEMLNKGFIRYLICQKPEEQAYKAIMAMFNHLMRVKGVKSINYSPIDIIIKENIKYYI